jgi:hypothetical protein
VASVTATFGGEDSEGQCAVRATSVQDVQDSEVVVVRVGALHKRARLEGGGSEGGRAPHECDCKIIQWWRW